MTPEDDRMKFSPVFHKGDPNTYEDYKWIGSDATIELQIPIA